MSLDSAIAEFLDCETRVGSADRIDLLNRYPHVAEELQAFFADHDRMQRLAAPLRTLSGNAHSSADPSVDAIGRYQIMGELGRGGMGVVYRARDKELGRLVALKMLSAGRFTSPAELERFRGEARLAAALSHPAIVPIHEAGEWQGLPFFAMGLVEGRSLSDLLQEGPLPADAAAPLLRQVATAVAYAHRQGIVHRDLKPANILLKADDEGRLVPAITDFGLAKRLDGEEHLTTTGQVLGTPAFMSPEQAAGSNREVGAASDIYSLGAILYAMLTGRPPFRSESPVETILQVLENDPEPPHRLVAGIPRDLEAICLRCLEKRADRRYATAQDLVDDLSRYLQHEPPLAANDSILRRVRRWGRREPLAAWHLGGIAFVLLMMQFIFVLHPQRDLAYHLQVCAPLFAWLLGCLVLQLVVRRESLRQPAHYFWCAIDTLFLTAALAMLSTPIALLMSAYFLLVCAAGLFFRTRLVAFSTVLAIVASTVLLSARPEARDPWHHALVFEALLAIVGFVVGYQVWRFRVLREYYEK